MFEHRSQKIVSARVFARRLALYAGIAMVSILAVLCIGVAGYHYFAGLKWIDALLNAAMILGGMGPVDALTRPAAKVFASAYALFSGLVFIAIMGIILAPIVHRILHTFHVDGD